MSAVVSSNNLEDEYMWSCCLDKDNKEFLWLPEDPAEGDDEEKLKPVHRLIIKNAILMPDVEKDAVHVVQIDAEGFHSKKLSVPVVTMRGQVDYQHYVELLVPSPAKIKLLSGDGPLHLTGIHCVEYPSSKLVKMPYSTRTSVHKEISHDSLHKEIIYYDLETIGFNKHKGVEILEIGAISSSQGETFQQYILPTRPIPPEATSVHGIFMKESCLYINEGGAARRVEAVDKVTAFKKFITWMQSLQGKITLAGYNSHNFDDRVLCHEMQGVVEKDRLPIHRFADVSKVVKPVLVAEGITKWNLGFAVHHFLKRNQERAHGALSDAKDCRDLLIKIGEIKDKTTEELLLENSYAEKDFDDVWEECFKVKQSTIEALDDEEGEEIDVSEDARLLLKAIQFASHKAGINLICLFLMGSSGKKIWSSMKKSNLYGSGKHKPKDYWKYLTEVLLKNKYLDELRQVDFYGHGYNGYKVNSLGMEVINNKDFKVKMKPTKEFKPIEHVIRPRYSSTSGSNNNEGSSGSTTAMNNNWGSVMPSAVLTTYSSFEKSKDVEEVARKRGVKESTVLSHLAAALELGAPVDIHELNVSESMLEDVSRVIRKKPLGGNVSKLKPIKIELEIVGSDVGYDQIKLIVAQLKVEHGVNHLGILQWKDADVGHKLTEEGQL